MIYQNRGFYGQKIDSQCQINNLNTLIGTLVSALSLIMVNLNIFLKTRLAHSHMIYQNRGFNGQTIDS